MPTDTLSHKQAKTAIERDNELKPLSVKRCAIRFATYLAPNVYPVYQCVADYAGRQLGCRTELAVGESFAAFAAGEVDVGFICGLPYVQLTRSSPAPVELLAAPVLQGERYRDLPIYFSDVIVRRDSPYHVFADLRGCRWAYNDPNSHSGYNITRSTLVRLGETRGFRFLFLAQSFEPLLFFEALALEGRNAIGFRLSNLLFPPLELGEARRFRF